MKAICASPDLARILSLPRRVWTDDKTFASELTRVLARRKRGMQLRPNQAQALYEMAEHRGAALPQRVGSGKTLISALAPAVLGSKRPLLLLPASLVGKTKVEFAHLSEHWDVPNYYRIESYETLSRIGSVTALDAYGPDLVFCDEAHKLKNLDAGVTRRVARYREEHPECVFVAASGTFTRTSILDFAHLLRWCLGAVHAPVPIHKRELRDWASLLDAKDTDIEPGALIALADPPSAGAEDPRTRVRLGYGRRLNETPGIVATHDSPNDIGCSLVIRHVRHSPPPDLQAALTTLRDKWETPDEWPLFDGKDVQRHARELALGFFYRWDPRPPKDWLEARKVWSANCRKVLRNNQRNLDTQFAVVNHILQHPHDYPTAALAYRDWSNIKDSFEPRTEPVWISNWGIERVREWIRKPGIVWTEHRAFAERLEKELGISYYGRRGVNRYGQTIESHPTDSACIASIKANSTGRNLQHWSRALVVSPGMNAALWEQNLGRLHRDGQKADSVEYDVFILTPEHEAAWDEALNMSRFQEEVMQQEQKLIYADKVT